MTGKVVAKRDGWEPESLSDLNRWLLKRLYRLLAPPRVKNYLAVHRLLVEEYGPPEFVPIPQERRLLVLAPHIDDEVIGCGGVIGRLSRLGAEITVVYLTDGRRGNPALYERADLLPEQQKGEEERLVRERKEEARRAAAILGIGRQIFLNRPDGALEADAELISQVERLLRELRPEAVYLPFVTDRHPDHLATNRIFVGALKGGKRDFQCVGYETWGTLYPNCLVDISEAVEAKRRALEQFSSQMLHSDLVRIFLGLNRYRSIYFGGRGYAEAFFRTTPEGYLYLYREICST